VNIYCNLTSMHQLELN